MLWDFLLGKRPSEDAARHSRRVRRRLVFEGTANATLEGFEAMWKIPADSDLRQTGTLFAADAFIRQEYVEIYELIQKKFQSQGGQRTALVRGSSGTGKSAFLQYLVARIRNEANDVLIVRGSSFNSNPIQFLHLSTGWFGRKTATKLATYDEARSVEKKCTWTIVDGCDWEPIANCTVGAASPSTPWKGFRKVDQLVHICMPPWSLSQLEQCATSTDNNLSAVRENYKLIGGIARWALGSTSNSLDQVDSAVNGINFETLQQVMATQHSSKTDEKELVHRLVLWKTPLDQNGNWIYEVNAENHIHYSLLSNFVCKQLVEKAAKLSLQKRKLLISDLKFESAASAYRGVIFEADAIDRLVCGGTYKLRKCMADGGTPQEVELTLPNTRKRYAMAGLDKLSVESVIGQIIVPDAKNFESVDAFRVGSPPILQQAPATPPAVHYETLQFQMTVGESHPTKFMGIKKIMEKIRKDLPNADVTCAVVFVVPDDMQAFYETPQSVLKNDRSVRVQCDGDFSSDNQYCLVIDYGV